MSQEGSKYYVDHNSGKTQWDRPTVSNAVRSATLPRAGQQYAFAMIKPHDPHSLSVNWNWLYIMFGMREARSGPSLLSLVCLPIAEAESSAVSHAQLDAVKSKASGDSLNNIFGLGLLRGQVDTWISRPMTSAVGPYQNSKIQDGAPVVVSFDLDSLTVGTIAAEQLGETVVKGMGGQVSMGGMGHYSMLQAMTDGSANLSQGYGLLWRPEDEDTGMLYVEFLRSDEGNHFQHDTVPGMRLLYETAARAEAPYGGFYCAVHPGRVIAHAMFRNMFLTDTLETLRWHMAVLYPEAVTLTDVQFVDEGGRVIPEGDKRLWEGYAFDKLERKEVRVTVRGREVMVVDTRG